MKRLWKRLRGAPPEPAPVPGRFYGDGNTIHGSTEVDVEVYDGKVVAVWFRCTLIPFEQVNVDRDRAAVMLHDADIPEHLAGVVFREGVR